MNQAEKHFINFGRWSNWIKKEAAKTISQVKSGKL